MKYLNAKELTTARELLYHYGYEGGHPTGSFTTNLIRTMESADSNNLDTLVTAFPEFRLPVQILQNYGGSVLADMVKRTDEALRGNHG